MAHTTNSLAGEILHLDSVIKSYRETSIPVLMNLSGRPHFALSGPDNNEVNRYGIIRNRAPKVVGPVALSGTLISDGRNTTGLISPAVLFDGLEGETYGKILDPNGYNELKGAIATRELVDYLLLDANQV